MPWGCGLCRSTAPSLKACANLKTCIHLIRTELTDMVSTGTFVVFWFVAVALLWRRGWRES